MSHIGDSVHFYFILVVLHSVCFRLQFSWSGCACVWACFVYMHAFLWF